MATIKKKLPYELYDVAGLEDWFSQMAAEGYHLVDCWQNKAEFTVATPKENVRYRLEAVETYQYDWNKDKAYSEAGWEHVTTILGFFYIFQCDDPMVPELHTDPTIQSWTMRKLIRKQWFLMIWMPLYWAFMQREVIGGLVNSPMEQLKNLLLIEPLMYLSVLTILILVYFCWTQGTMIWMLTRLKKRLASGLPMDRTKRYPRSILRHFSGWVLLILFFVTFFFLFKDINKQSEPVNVADYPHVNLEDVIPGRYDYAEEVSFWTGASLEKSFFVPVHFEYGDAGVMEDYSRVRTYLHYYETRWEWTADVLLQGSMEALESDQKEQEKQAEKYPHIFKKLKMSTGAMAQNHERLDELYCWDYQYSTSELNRVYFGRMGNKVFTLYTILPDPEVALELMIEKIQSE